jgi:hypothetical protein
MLLLPRKHHAPLDKRWGAFPQDHLAGVAPDAEIEAFAPHRPQLRADQPLNNHGRFFAGSFALAFAHIR